MVLQNQENLVRLLKDTSLIVDCTLEGMLHAPELPEILSGGARVIMVSNEHPEALERCLPQSGLEEKVRKAVKKARQSRA